MNIHIGDQILRTTLNHPFYVRGQGWKSAEKLKIGDALRTAQGKWIAITDLFENGDIEPVFNLRVADHHTYFVGEGVGVLVHNQSPEGQKLVVDLQPKKGRVITDEDVRSALALAESIARSTPDPDAVQLVVDLAPGQTFDRELLMKYVNTGEARLLYSDEDEVIVFKFQAPNGTIQKALFLRLKDYHGAGAGSAAATYETYRDQFQFIGIGPSGMSTQLVVDGMVFGPKASMKESDGAGQLIMMAHMVPGVGAADHYSQGHYGYGTLALVGDVFMVGGFLARAGKSALEKGVLATVAYGEVGLAIAQSGMAIHEAYNSKDNLGAAANAGDALLNMLIAAGAVKQLRAGQAGRINNAAFELAPSTRTIEGMGAPSESQFFDRQINEFINNWQAEPILEAHIRERMQQLGIHPKQIGIIDDVETGTAFSMEHGWGGRNTRPAWSGAEKGGINVDYGVFDPEHLPVPSWRTGSLRDRIDAVIIHELMEYNSRAATTALRHRSAILRSPSTAAEISPGARKILDDYRTLQLKGR